MTTIPPKLKSFFLPTLNRPFVIRLLIVTVVAVLVFGFVFRPFRINGSSMHPTYRDGQFILGFAFKYRLRALKRGDVVMVKLAGTRVMYLKRVVAFSGETVEIRQGTLYIDNKALDEPYVNGPCQWKLQPRQVEPGFIYVIGDNRAIPMEAHQFGAVLKKRIYGGPLW